MTDIAKLLQQERTLTPAAAAFTAACSITGGLTWVVSNHSTWQQWTVIFHVLTGIGFSLITLLYLYIHFNRTVGISRFNVLFSGLVAVIPYAVFVASGCYLAVIGQQERDQWVYTAHIAGSVFLIVMVVFHLYLHIKLVLDRKTSPTESNFPSVPDNTGKQILITNVAVVLLILAATLVYDSTNPRQKNTQRLADDELFKFAQLTTYNGAFVDKEQIANSYRCATCHHNIVEQWLSSAHSHAASDPAYLSSVNALVETRGIPAVRYCESCHSPVSLLSGELPSSIEQQKGNTKTAAALEGVSCMGCHGIDAKTQRNGAISYYFKPRADYLFFYSENPLLYRLHDWLIRLRPDQHKEDFGKVLFKEPVFCSFCHSQYTDKNINNFGRVKIQDDYTSWLSSPFSKSEDGDFSNTQLSRCQDCHMPLTDSNDPSADEYGKIRAHHFPGANTFLPLLRGDEKQLSAVKRHLQSNKLRVTINPPNRLDAIQTLHALDERLRNFNEAPYYYYLGETADIRVAVSNRGVGHDFPGGKTDINESWVEFLVMDSEGRLIYESGGLRENNDVDREAHFYGSTPINKTGVEVWYHQAFDMVGESFRRIISPGESDIITYTFVVPSWAKSPVTVTAALKYRKINNRYAKWALQGQSVLIPVVDLAWDSLEIPIKIRKEVE